MDGKEKSNLVAGVSVLVAILAFVSASYLLGVMNDGLHRDLYRDADAIPWVGLVLAALLPGMVAQSLWFKGVIEARAALIIAGAGLAFGAFLYWDLDRSSDSLKDAVSDYCLYGAANRQELSDCLETTPPGVAAFSNEPAGKFARDEMGCESDAGPFCARAERD